MCDVGVLRVNFRLMSDTPSPTQQRCVVPSHGDRAPLYARAIPYNGTVVVCGFCSLECYNAFVLDPELLIEAFMSNRAWSVVVE